MLQLVPLPPTVSLNRPHVLWVPGAWLNWPSLRPIPVSTQHGPDYEPRDVAIPIDVGMDREELYENPADKYHQKMKFGLARELGIGQSEGFIQGDNPQTHLVLQSPHGRADLLGRIANHRIAADADRVVSQAAEIGASIIPRVVIASLRRQVREQLSVEPSRVTGNPQGIGP